jgi:hypothetical protein
VLVWVREQSVILGISLGEDAVRQHENSSTEKMAASLAIRHQPLRGEMKDANQEETVAGVLLLWFF